MTNQQRITIWLAASTLFCIAVYLVRVYYLNTWSYLFLNWNLFLAFAPLIWLHFMDTFFPWKHWTFKTITFGGWLLLFPNAPYILTDLMHLSNYKHPLIWLDVFVIISYALTGLLAGFVSLQKIINKLGKSIKNHWLTIGVGFILFLSAFGIYLGRFLRWNSWDIVNRPHHILSDVFDRLLHPFDHPRTWGMTLILGFLLNLLYWFIQPRLKQD